MGYHLDQLAGAAGLLPEEFTRLYPGSADSTETPRQRSGND